MIGRILRSADFERVLGTPSRARSVHFAVHYLAAMPSRPARPVKVTSEATSKAASAAKTAAPDDLSTGADPNGTVAVDEPAAVPADVAAQGTPVVAQPAPTGLWVGTVVPKRHARRAVTRTLLKRQIHRAVAVQAGASGLPHGLWVVRLRTPFDRKHFTSASSDALHDAAAVELSAVMADAARRAAR